MNSKILFSGKNKKNISICRLLKILPRVLSVNMSGLEHIVSYTEYNSSSLVVRKL